MIKKILQSILMPLIAIFISMVVGGIVILITAKQNPI